MAVWFAVPLTCLSNAGRVNKTSVLLASLTVKNYFFYHVEEGVRAQELTQTTPVTSGADRTSREHSSDF